MDRRITTPFGTTTAPRTTPGPDTFPPKRCGTRGRLLAMEIIVTWMDLRSEERSGTKEEI
jgi:hypothetical protein